MNLSRNEADQDWDLSNFCGRADELARFADLLRTPQWNTPSVIAYYGIAGTGKTWLQLRQQRIAAELHIPTARLNYDRQIGGSAIPEDFPWSLYSIRHQLNTECPSFELAYAWLRHKRGQAARPELKGHGIAATMFELIERLAEKGLQLGTGGVVKDWASVEALLGKQTIGATLEKLMHSGRLNSILEKIGFDDYVSLGLMSDEQIELQLCTRLAADLQSGLPLREGLGGAAQLRCAIFVDGMEFFDVGYEASLHQHLADAWVRSLCQHMSSFAVFVLAGQNRLDWEDFDPEWANYLDVRELYGLAREDAAHYLRRRGVPEGTLLDALLAVCRLENGFHPLSLGWCADVVKIKPTVTPEEFKISPGDWRALARRLLRSIPHNSERLWIGSLALTPRWDESAARTSYSDAKGRQQDAAWALLQSFSFVMRIDQQWWSIRDLVRNAIIAETKPYVVKEERQRWLEYWKTRQGPALSVYNGLAWVQIWYQQPTAARYLFHRAWLEARDAAQFADLLQMCEWPELLGLATLPLDNENVQMIRVWAEALLNCDDFQNRETTRKSYSLYRRIEAHVDASSDVVTKVTLQTELLACVLALGTEVSDDVYSLIFERAKATLVEGEQAPSFSITELMNADLKPAARGEFTPLSEEQCKEFFSEMLGRLRLNLMTALVHRDSALLAERSEFATFMEANVLALHDGEWSSELRAKTYNIMINGIRKYMSFADQRERALRFLFFLPIRTKGMEPRHQAMLFSGLSKIFFSTALHDGHPEDFELAFSMVGRAESMVQPQEFPFDWLDFRRTHLVALVSKALNEGRPPDEAFALWKETLAIDFRHLPPETLRVLKEKLDDLHSDLEAMLAKRMADGSDDWPSFEPCIPP